MTKKLSALLALLLITSQVMAADVYMSLVSKAQSEQPLIEDDVTLVRPTENYQSVGQIIQENAQVQAKDSGYGSTQYLIIKGQSKGILYIVDGVKLPQDATGTTDLSAISPANIESIEVIEGPQMQYGPNASNGVVIIKTKGYTKGATKVDAGLTYGSMHTSNLNAGVAGTVADTNLFFNVNGSVDQSDGYQEHSAFTKENAMATVGYDFENGSRLAFSTSLFKKDLELSGGTDVPQSEWDGHKEKVALTPNDWMYQSLSNNSLSYTSDLVDASAGYSYNKTQGYTWGSLDTTRIRTYEGRVVFKPVEGLKIGGDVTRRELKGDAYWLLQDKYSQNSWGAFAGYDWKLGKFTFSPYARYDYDTLYDDVVSGDFTAKFNISNDSYLYAKVGLGYSAPSIADYDTNKDLKREKSTNYEAGLKYNLGNLGDLTLSGFHTQYDDKIVSVETSPWVWTSLNVGEAEATGGRVGLTTTYGILENTIGVMYQHTHMNGHEIPNAPSLLGSLNTALKFGNVKIYNELQYSSKQKLYAADVYEAHLDAYWKDTIGVQYGLGGRGYLFAEVDNVFDEKYAKNGYYSYGTTYAYPEPGRVFKVGVKLSFWDWKH